MLCQLALRGSKKNRSISTNGSCEKPAISCLRTLPDYVRFGAKPMDAAAQSLTKHKPEKMLKIDLIVNYFEILDKSGVHFAIVVDLLPLAQFP